MNTGGEDRYLAGAGRSFFGSSFFASAYHWNVERACVLCGSTKNLVAEGPFWLCKWEAGCEHRQKIQDRTMQELAEALKEFDPVEEERHPCGHTFSEHREMMGEHRANLFEELVRAYKSYWGMD